MVFETSQGGRFLLRSKVIEVVPLLPGNSDRVKQCLFLFQFHETVVFFFCFFKVPNHSILTPCHSDDQQTDQSISVCIIMFSSSHAGSDLLVIVPWKDGCSTGWAGVPGKSRRLYAACPVKRREARY